MLGPNNMLFLLIMLYGCTSGFAFHINLFDFDQPTIPGHVNNKARSLEELAYQALESSLDSREKVQLVYQAYANSRAKLGDILPQIDVGSIITSSVDKAFSSETALPFVGFLFPNRWFDWKTLKILKQAEQENLATIYANKMLIMQNIYFDIQRQIWSIELLNFYINQITNLLDFITRNNNAPVEDLAILKNRRSTMIYQRAYIDALSSSLPLLATEIGLDPNHDWADLKIKYPRLTSIKNKEKYHYDDFWSNATLRSTELNNVGLILKAAESHKKSVLWDFFDPATSCTFGYGYVQRVKIASSSIDIIQIQVKRTQMQLSNAIQDALNNYNDSIDAYGAIDESLAELQKLALNLEEQLNDPERSLDITKIERFYKYATGQGLRFINLYFALHSSEANLLRYSWEGRLYAMTRNYIDTRLPQLLNATKKSYKFSRPRN
jgi:hypothetical protein